MTKNNSIPLEQPLLGGHLLPRNRSIFQQLTLISSVWSVTLVYQSLHSAVNRKQTCWYPVPTMTNQETELRKEAVLSARSPPICRMAKRAKLQIAALPGIAYKTDRKKKTDAKRAARTKRQSHTRHALMVMRGGWRGALTAKTDHSEPKRRRTNAYSAFKKEDKSEG